MTREKAQNNCLVSENGWEYMSYFDVFPPVIRARVRESRFNLCAACVGTVAYNLRRRASSDYIYHIEDRYYLKAIELIEKAIATGEGLDDLIYNDLSLTRPYYTINSCMFKGDYT